jgi:hypothetical protein
MIVPPLMTQSGFTPKKAGDHSTRNLDAAPLAAGLPRMLTYGVSPPKQGGNEDARGRRKTNKHNAFA